MATRKLPTGRKGSVLMKLDVEGQEMEIMVDLIMSGALAHLDNIHVDWDTLTSRRRTTRNLTRTSSSSTIQKLLTSGGKREKCWHD